MAGIKVEKFGLAAGADEGVVGEEAAATCFFVCLQVFALTDDLLPQLDFDTLLTFLEAALLPPLTQGRLVDGILLCILVAFVEYVCLIPP